MASAGHRQLHVLVTGGAGVLGASLINDVASDRRHQVTSIDIRPADVSESAARAVTGDIRDPALVDELMSWADVVVHCAAALPSHSPGEIRSVDVEGTRLLLEAAQRHGIERFVHLSSTAVYGIPRVQPTPEDHPLDAVDPYNRAKIDAEALCEEFRERGMCVTVLRPKTFLGPGRLGIFAMLFEWAGEGRNFPVLGSGDVRCQMLDVADLCDAVVASLHRPAARVNDTFNIAAATFGTLRSEFQAVLDMAGRGGRVVSIPARPAVAALRTLEVLRLSPVYERLARKLLADSYVSIAKAQDALGFSPRFSNEESLLRTYAWYRENYQSSGATPTGRTHGEPWRQGALRLAKAVF